MSETTYLNTDLELVSRKDLSSLAAVFEASGLVSLNCVRRSAREWHANFETVALKKNPQKQLDAMLTILEATVDKVREPWDGCVSRDVNIGFECGTAPFSYEEAVSNATLLRVAKLGLGLRFTLYGQPPGEGAAARS